MGKQGKRKTISLKKFVKLSNIELPYNNISTIKLDGEDSCYEIRDNGIIMSYRAGNGKGYTIKPKPIIGGCDSDGYHIACLRQKGIQYTVKVHRLVASAFIPNPNNLTDVNHKNGIKLDNRVENLEWVSNIDNIIDREINGLGYKISDAFNIDNYYYVMTLVQCTYKSNDEISDITGLPTTFIQMIRDFNKYDSIKIALDIQEKYFRIPGDIRKSKKIHQIYDEVIIRKISKMIEDNNHTLKEISEITGADMIFIKKIYNRRAYKHITNQYMFPKKEELYK